MYTPVPCTTRKLSEPVTVEGVTFPVGSVIDLHPHLMHHNPSVWEDHMVGMKLIHFSENHAYFNSLFTSAVL